MHDIDLIIHNAVVRTMDATTPVATAFASSEGTLVAVGDDQTIVAMGTENTQIVDAGGAAIVPGMIDAHNHHNMAGENDLFKLNIDATMSTDDICAAVMGWISTREVADGDWVTGGGWAATLLDELKDPASLAKLDAASPRHPVVLRDDSHHQKWVNTAALQRSGIDAQTPDPDGGTIWRDSSGSATGLLLEGACAIPERAQAAENTQSAAEYAARCSERGIEILAEYGVTAFQDASSTQAVLEGLQLLDRDNRLAARVITSMPLHDAFFGFDLVGRPLVAGGQAFRTERHFPDYTKIWLDGVPMNQTTAFLEPYLPSDEHGHEHRGATIMPYTELEEWLRYLDEAGLGLKVHATGDASVRMVLDAVQKVRADGMTVRVQIAHATFVHPDDVGRFKELDVIAEVSPAIWTPSVLTDAIRAVVPESLMEHMYPIRDLLETGALVVIGTDWPVPPTPNPWIAIYGLVTRKDPAGNAPGTLNPDQAISVADALAMYTVSSARALGLEDIAGRIAPGLSADFVVLSADPMTVEAENLKTIMATQTWFQGRQVFARS